MLAPAPCALLVLQVPVPVGAKERVSVLAVPTLFHLIALYFHTRSPVGVLLARALQP